MKKYNYEVTIKVTHEYDLEVKADNEKEAEELAFKMFEKNPDEYYVDADREAVVGSDEDPECNRGYKK